MHIRIYLVLSVLFLSMHIQAQTSLYEWQNPEVFRINKEPARSFFHSFTHDRNVFADQPWQEDNYQLLNGQWEFNWVNSPKRKPADFFSANYNDARWDLINVPANWELNGYGSPFYHSHHCFKPQAIAPEMPTTYNPVGSYRKTFKLSKENVKMGSCLVFCIFCKTQEVSPLPHKP
ncbi:MAG: hypothetical protein HRT37_20235 [Alteromonadaceae bacterium]|nr:hypothetical protein [Alteromonadaceae bacterium]